MGGWGSLLDRVTSWLPIPKRIEGIKNEIDKLEKEKKQLLKGVCDDKASKRMAFIDDRLIALNARLRNIASD